MSVESLGSGKLRYLITGQVMNDFGSVKPISCLFVYLIQKMMKEKIFKRHPNS